MKLYAPSYYKKFICTADKCDHSCCIGWEIDVDSKSLARYKSFTEGYGHTVANSISQEGTPHFVLCGDDRCPHLDEKGLCKIILLMGEDQLCDICREHPRFYNYTEVAEAGLGMSCREAARLILTSEDYHIFEEAGEAEAEAQGTYFYGRGERGRIYGILKDKTKSYSQRLNRIYSEYGIDPLDDGVWTKIIASLEYLDGDHKELFFGYSKNKRPKGADEYLERALAYYIYRHCTEATDEEDFLCRLSFCLFLERLLASLGWEEKDCSPEKWAVLASIISEEIEYSEDNTWALTY